MKMLKKLLLGMMLVLAASQAQARQTIRFATEATYPPFEFLGEGKSLQGFDIEIAQAMCRKLDAECEFVNQPFATLMRDLDDKKIDAVVAALGVTGSRKEFTAFTNPYYKPEAIFVALKKTQQSLKKIAGKRIGVQQGSTFEKYLHTKYRKRVKVVPYEDVQQALAALKQGKVDLVLGDTPTLYNWLLFQDQQNACGFISDPIHNKHFFGDGYGIAVREEDEQLLKQLNFALAQIKRDGTYQRISDKYFGKNA